MKAIFIFFLFITDTVFMYWRTRVYTCVILVYKMGFFKLCTLLLQRFYNGMSGGGGLFFFLAGGGEDTIVTKSGS